MNRHQYLWLLVVLGISLAKVSAAPESTYEMQDGWRMFTRAQDFAFKGDKSAIHDCFLAAYLRASSPFLGGEDLEAISGGLAQLLYMTKDRKFSEALTLERPEVIGAVKLFLGDSPSFVDIGKGDGHSSTPSKNLRLKDYPKTKVVLDSAPKTDFPLQETSPRRAPLLKHLLP